MAKSLIEGIDAGRAPSKKATRSGDSGKLIFALVLLCVAGLVFAWSQGWILAGASKEPQVSAQERAEQQKAFTEQQKHTDQQIKSGAAKIGGAS